MNIRITAVQFDADQRLKELIDKKVRKFETFFDKIIDVEVFLRLENKGAQVQQKNVHIKVNIPGDTLFAEGSSTSFEESLDSAADSVKKQIKKYKEKFRNS